MIGLNFLASFLRRKVFVGEIILSFRFACLDVKPKLNLKTTLNFFTFSDLVKIKSFFYAKMEKQTRNDSKRFMSVTSEIIKHCHTLNRITNTFIFVISAQDPKYFNLQSLSIYKMDHWDIGPWLWLMW